jgi:hypothetical protein
MNIFKAHESNEISLGAVQKHAYIHVMANWKQKIKNALKIRTLMAYYRKQAIKTALKLRTLVVH